MITNKKMSLDDLMRERETVLQTWPTGKDALSLDASFSYCASLPASKNFSRAMAAAHGARQTLLQPRAGVALLTEHIRLLRYLQDEGLADLLPTTIDSYTRLNRYAEAEKGLQESRAAGRSLLNGLPVVNHGVPACREIIASLDKPVQIRHGTPDARLLAELSFAAGFSAFEGGGISYNIPYAKNISLEASIRFWQYVDRLTGVYAEQGIPINREPFGPLTGTLIPPCISACIAIIEALLAAEQGVKDLTLGYGQCGNLIQDMAAIEALRTLGNRYLTRYGYTDVALTTVFHQWMGGFPQDESRAYGVIAWGAVAGLFSGATKIITKSPHEALGIPSAEANAYGLKTTRQVVNLIKDQEFYRTEALEKETELICEETEALLSAVLKLGEGDVAAGAIRAFEAGVLDVPFAPSRATRGIVFPARDLLGAVRILEFGNLPIPDSIKQLHRAKLEKRAAAEGRLISFQMVTDDIYAISKGQLVGKQR